MIEENITIKYNTPVEWLARFCNNILKDEAETSQQYSWWQLYYIEHQVLRRYYAPFHICIFVSNLLLLSRISTEDYFLKMCCLSTSIMKNGSSLVWHFNEYADEERTRIIINVLLCQFSLISFRFLHAMSNI